MLDLPKRLETVRDRMDERDISLLFLTPGANLFYLAGIPHRDHYRTDHNAYGDWAVGAYIGLPEGIVLTAGDADFISLCRPLICEPDLPRRLREGQARAICTSGNRCWPKGPGEGIACRCVIRRPQRIWA